MSVRVPPLGPLLGPSWGGLSWAVLGASRAVLAPSWAVLGPSWGPLGPSWGGLWGLVVRLGASEARKGENPKNIGNIQRKSMIWVSWGSLGMPLGALFRPLGPSWGHLGRLGALLGRLGGLLDPLGRFLGPSWPVLGPSGLSKIQATDPKSARERQVWDIWGPGP